MKFTLPGGMADALRLTRTGDLTGATETLRAMLGGAPVKASADTPAGPIIDLKPERAQPDPTPARATRTGSFTERSYRGPAGVLAYRVYLPADARPGMPLVVMLHGCTQSPEDFAAGTGMNRMADTHGFIVAYPRQPQSANAQKCWNWFRPGDQQRDRGEPALIAAMTRQLLADEQADPARVYVAGLSAGGAAAAIMAARYPDLYAAVGIHSGLACGAASDLPSALAAMRSGGSGDRATPTGRSVPVITFHGDRDTTVSEANARAIIAGVAAGGDALTTTTETGRSPGGRGFTRTIGSRDAGGTDARGAALYEQWTIHGAGHAWSGGDASGTYTDPAGPDASAQMWRFFAEHPRMAGRD